MDRGARDGLRAGSGDGDEPLQGAVERVTYSDESTQYLVLRVAPEEGYNAPTDALGLRSKLVTAVGRAPAPGEGLRVRLVGRWGRHEKHGDQFEFATLEVLPPLDTQGLVKYLASSAFEGVGEVLARRIVDALGTDALERIRDEPGALDRVRGLRPAVRAQLVESVRRELGTHRVHAFLRGLGLGPWQAAAVVRKLGGDCEASVRADPYLLARGIAGIGFATADRVADEMGLAAEDPRRLAAAAEGALRAAADDGHSLLPRAELVQRARTALEATGRPVRELAFDGALETLEREGAIHVDRSFAAADGPHEGPEGADVYLPALAHSERALAENLALLLAAAPLTPLAEAAALDAAADQGESPLDAMQRDAVLGLLATPVGLLTGGPGVGKTTILRRVVALAEHAGARVRLASPTGRAAKRLGEATGHDAQTIHRMLGYDPSRDEPFLHNARHPLEADIVIVDEVSMLDVVLAHHLLKALQPPTRLVLIGDPNQLPSVGPGNVLADLLASGVVPCYRLERIYRQSERSLIVANAHRVLHGELPHLPDRGDHDADFYFFPADEPETCAERLVEVVTRRIPETFGLEWIRDVQVIAPMYRGACGDDAHNDRLREELHATGREVRQGARVWRVGDRVIHVRNDYDKEVFNGDMGRIHAVALDGGVTVTYPEREVVYAIGELSDLQPAFAITVHRSQGGEFPAVVIPLVTQHYMMLQRHLLYTAITRARQLVVLVGSERALRMAIDNVAPRERKSRLADRLRAARPD